MTDKAAAELKMTRRELGRTQAELQRANELLDEVQRLVGEASKRGLWWTLKEIKRTIERTE